MEEKDLESLKLAAAEKVNEAAKAIKDEFEAKLQEKEKAISDLTAIVEKQGLQIEKSVSQKGRENTRKQLAEAYEKLVEGGESAIGTKTLITRIGNEDVAKAWTSTDTISSSTQDSTAYPAAGVTGLLATLGAYFSYFVDWFSKPLPKKSKILELVDVIPLVSGTMHYIVDGVTGSVAITPECNLKPIVKPTLDQKSITADPVAAVWKVTRHMLKLYSVILDRFQKKVFDLIGIEIPNVIINYVTTQGVAYSSTGVSVPNPTHYDAIIAAVLQVRQAGYFANGILINPVDYANMILDKDHAGNYKLMNFGSIAIVDGQVKFDGEVIPYIIDDTITAGYVCVGDFSVVKVGLDGVTDFYTGWNNEDDGRRNLLMNVAEKWVAKGILDTSAVVYDTFANILSDIDNGLGCDCPAGEATTPPEG